MKGVKGKFKGLAIKQLLLNHAEKIILGSVGLFVLLALATTTWSGIDKQPAELLSSATKAGQDLHTGAWPAEEQAKFTDSTYMDTMLSMSSKLTEHGRVSPMFAYDKPMSFPLYPRIEPKSEPTFPPVGMMIADAGEMIMAIIPEQPAFDETTGGAADFEDGAAGNPRFPRPPGGPTAGVSPMGPTSAGAGRGGKGGPRAGGGLTNGMTSADVLGPMGPMGPMAAGMMSGMESSGSGFKPRGQRYVAVRGIVDLDQYHKAIRDALRLDQLEEARSYLEFVDVKVQRQKAVAGPNPWLEDNWVDVDIAKADEVFKECELAQDIVMLELTDPVITMPLPARLDKDYTDKVSHPYIKNYQLSKEQREQQEKIIRALQEEWGGEGEAKPRRRGFSGVTQDVRGMQQDFLSNSGNMNDVYKRAGISPMGGAGGGPRAGQMMGAQTTLLPMQSRGGMAGGMGMPPAMAGGAGMAGRGPSALGMTSANAMRGGAMPGAMGRPGQPGQGGVQQLAGEAAVGYVLMFRYLDFDVSPGEAYRYRVQLVVANPNLGESLDRVREASVAEGETRETPWSEPTAPVVVQQDTNVFLTKLDERTRSRGEAELKVIQRDSILGTFIDTDALRVKPGQFVGGLASSKRLDLGTPAFTTQTVLFATKEFLADTSIPAKIIPNEHPDLKLSFDSRQSATATALGAMSEALVMNEHGEIHLLENSDKERRVMENLNKIIADEREPWKDLEGQEELTGNRLDAAGAEASGMMMPTMPTGTSSAKRGRGGRYTGAVTSMDAMGGAGAGAGAAGNQRRGGRGGAAGRTSMDAMGGPGAGGAGAGRPGTGRPGR